MASTVTYHVLEDYPYGLPYPSSASGKGFYDKKNKVSVWAGSENLPDVLEPYRTKPYSLSWWKESRLNTGRMNLVRPSDVQFTPRDHQVEASEKILEAYRSGWRGFLEADSTGLGKTLSVLSGATRIALEAGFSSDNKANILIVCPKSVIPQWRQTILAYEPAMKVLNPLIVNYQRLNHLLDKPKDVSYTYKRKGKTVKMSTSRANRVTAAKGVPSTRWDIVVFDEAHSLKNYPTSNTSLAAASVAGLEKRYVKVQAGRVSAKTFKPEDSTPFTVFSTATPGATPLNLAVMAGIISPLLSDGRTRVSPSGWGEFLKNEGFAVDKTKSGWVWATVPWYGKDSKNPQERRRFEQAEKKAKQVQRKDSLRIGRALTRNGAPFIRRSPTDIAGWPEQQIVPYPLEMSATENMAYKEAWTRFRNFLKLPPAQRDPKTALVENLRYRQKSSLLKVPSMVDFIEEQVSNGKQVYVSCEFMETIDKYVELLSKRRIKAVEISGRNVADREKARLQFQRGEAKVVLCTVVAGISLHAGETLPDGSSASDAERVTVIHDVRQDNLSTDQACGRAHRSGMNSVTFFPYLEGTVEERVIQSYTNKTANMRSMSGYDSFEAEEQERIFLEAAQKD